MSLPDLNDMLYFAEVVQQGGFAAASRKLQVPKSKLSRRVAALEERLGVRLLQRTTRKLRLTEVGETYLRHCVALREEAHAAADAVEQVRAQPTGLLRVACPVSIMHSPVGEAFSLYLQKNPLVRLDLRVSNRAVDLIEEGFDVALRVRPTPEDSPSLVVKSFGQSHGVLVASRELLQRQGRPASIDGLKQLDAVAMSMADGKAQWCLLGPEGQEATHHFQPRAVADDLLALKSLVQAGLGMSMLPDYMVRAELNGGQFEEVLPGWAPVAALFHAVFPSRRGMLPSVRGFLDFLDAHIRSLNCADGMLTPLNHPANTVKPRKTKARGPRAAIK